MSVFASCFGGTRFVILVLATSCLTLVISNASVFNFAVICMHNQTNSADDSWLSTPSMVNSLFASPAIGAFLFTFPLSFLITKFGLRLTFTLYCFSSAISTVLFPIAVQIGFPAVFLARFLQGIATALSFTATAQIAAQWTTEKGGATYISILTCHLQIAGVMSMLITAAFCESFIGWSGAFYFHGVGSVILFAVFLIYYRDDPKTHGHVSSDELASIQEGKALTHVHEEVPYKAIFMDPCVWGIWLSMAGATVGFLVLIIYGPIYINRIIGLDVASTGMATAIPNILALILKFILGPISDSANCVSQRVRLIILASVSQFITAAFMLLMAYIIAQAAFTAVIVFGGLNAVGTIKCAQMVYGRHVHFVMAVVSLLFGVIAQVLPFAAGAVVPDHTPEQWSLLLHILAVISVVASIPFVFVCKETPLKVQGNSADALSAEEQVRLRDSS